MLTFRGNVVRWNRDSAFRRMDGFGDGTPKAVFGNK